MEIQITEQKVRCIVASPNSTINVSGKLKPTVTCFNSYKPKLPRYCKFPGSVISLTLSGV